MNKKIIIPIVVVAVVGMITAGVMSKKEKGKPVFMEEVKQGEFLDTISATGALQPRIQVDIMSDVMGKIIELPVREGDLVEAGDLVVRIDDRDLKSEVRRQQASARMSEIQVENQRVQLEKAEREFKRKERLFASELISIEEYELAQTTLDAAKLTLKQYQENVAQSQALLQKTEEQLDKTVIRSPIAGRITALHKELGEQVIQGTINVQGSVIMEISDMSAMDLEVEVNEIESARIRLDMEADVELEALTDKSFRGRVVEIGQSAYKPTGRDISVFKVKAELLELDDAMKPGMTGRAEIEIARKTDVMHVPIQAVRTDDDTAEKFCYVVENDKAVRKVVQTGLSNDAATEITDGLKLTDKVITGPYRTLKNLKADDPVREKKRD